MPIKDLTLIGPEVYLTILAILVLVLDLFAPARWRNLPACVAAVGLVGGFIPLIWLWSGGQRTELAGALVISDFTIFFKGLFLIAGVLVILISTDFLRDLPQGYGEFFSLIVFLVLGMSILASANDLIVLYIAFELVSLMSYILAAYLRNDRKSNEAGIKYFLYGAAASAMMLYGLSLIYGIGGSTNLMTLRESLLGRTAMGAGLLAPLGLVLVGVGLGYKIAMAPFHAWAPDVYEGAPTPVTALLSVGPKAAGFAILARVFWQLGPPLVVSWPMILALLASVTMFTGNLLAIRQTDMKRMLAYSSIAHAGYLLIPVVVGPRAPWAAQSLLFYLGAYLLMNLGAFAIVILLETNTGDTQIARYAGLARSEPVIAAFMFILLLSLTGIPGTAGFVGKFLLFGSAINSGGWYWLAIVGIVNSVISLYYYMNVVRTMYFVKGEGVTLAARPVGLVTVVYVTLAGTLLLGLAPMALLALSEHAAQLTSVL
jgi:NADH-quinone oxidoreductase subunit N